MADDPYEKSRSMLGDLPERGRNALGTYSAFVSANPSFQADDQTPLITGERALSGDRSLQPTRSMSGSRSLGGRR